ncbi:MAG: DUF4411 family protein [Sedimentisphaerales bacterium]|nr:DUF4411 family protein [Sedimentisphaerales bacterium]
MPEAVKYILDANIFIEAKRRYYAFDLCPGFWSSLLHHNSMGNLESIDRVEDELSEGDDLDVWKKQASGLFASTNIEFVLTSYRDIIQWAQSQERFSDAAKSEFASGADAWVIAYAKANNATVVTHEMPDPKSRKRVKIPDVCKYFNVKYTNTFDMLRELGVAFNWGTP